MIDLQIRIPYKIGVGKFSLQWWKTLRRQLATDINELSQEQLLAYCRTMAETYEKEGQRKVMLFCRLYKIPVLLMYAMDIAQVAQLTIYLKPLLENPRLELNLLPVLKVKTLLKAALLYGPGDRFKHVRLGEFIVAHQYFEAFQRGASTPGAAQQSQNETCLDLMIAALWRPTDHKDRNAGQPFGDKREAFHPDKLMHNARLTATLPAEVKLAIYYYFAGCMKDLAERYDTLFSGSGEGEGDWLDLVRTLPSDKFGTIEQCEQLYVHAAFDLVNRMMLDDQKRSAK